MSSGNDLLMNSGKAPATLDFGKVPGTTRGGVVVAGPTEYHAREYDARNPGRGPLKYYDDGNPVRGLWIDVQTDERTAGDDNGIRRLYCEKRRMREAIRDAVLAVGGQGVEHGGQLWVTWTGEEPSQGGMPATTWAARYIPPGSSALMAGGPVAPQGAPPGTATFAQGGQVHQFTGHMTVPAAVQVAPPAATPATPAAHDALARYAQAANPVAVQTIPATLPGAVPASAPVGPPGSGAPVQYVPASVYHAMVNAGVDVAGFQPIPGT